MIVCHCKRVSDGTIRRHLDNGATTEADIANACGAGTGCGGCRPHVRELVAEARAADALRPVGPAAAAARQGAPSPVSFPGARLPLVAARA